MLFILFFFLSLISDLADDAARTAHMQPKAEGICSRTGLFVSKQKLLNLFFFKEKETERLKWIGSELLDFRCYSYGHGADASVLSEPAL
jgi:hypothetical protein